MPCVCQSEACADPSGGVQGDLTIQAEGGVYDALYGPHEYAGAATINDMIMNSASSNMTKRRKLSCLKRIGIGAASACGSTSANQHDVDPLATLPVSTNKSY